MHLKFRKKIMILLVLMALSFFQTCFADAETKDKQGYADIENNVSAEANSKNISSSENISTGNASSNSSSVVVISSDKKIKIENSSQNENAENSQQKIPTLASNQNPAQDQPRTAQSQPMQDILNQSENYGFMTQTFLQSFLYNIQNFFHDL